ncbi:hypothetical protein BH10PAT1_BH10PAT1_0880 [soil metagenome]
MVDNLEPETIDQKITVVTDWVTKMSETGQVENMDPVLLREVLSTKGANFEVLKDENLKSKMGKYTNLGKGPAMTAVWGAKFENYKIWTKSFIASYETDILKGRELPKLGTSGIKNSGMIQFFGEITALAAGELSGEMFKTYMEARIHNGNVWKQYPDKEDRIKHQVKIAVPTSDGEEIRIGSVAPEFPLAAWEFLRK